MVLRRLASCFAVAIFLFNQVGSLSCLAQESGSATTSACAAASHCHHGDHNWHSQPTNLDLSSTTASATAGHIAQTPININVGGAAMTVTQGMALTPAQMIAAYQVARSGQQSILLGADGAAIGGSFTLGSHLASHLNNLVIPSGVTVIDRSANLNLLGNLTNAGTIQAVGNQNISTVNINASNIYNSGLLNSLLNLNLFAVNDIINSGSITSAGNLTMTAGNSIQNLGTAAVMQAVNNLNMNTANIANAGLMAATTGNINIASMQNINVNSLAGTLQALNGAINIRDAGYAGTSNINLYGGNWLSQNLNLYSGTGAIAAQIDQVTGEVSSYAGAAHFSADTANLVLGDNCITGDPTYANTGDITINGNISPSEALAIIAGGNIIGNATSSISSNFAVTLVAGAHITSGGGTGGQTVSNGDPGVVAPVTYQFDNTAGGNIDLTLASSNPVIVTVASPVTLLANSNSATTGNIWFPTSGTSVQTNNGSGNAGNVLIVAGGNGGTAQSGSIAAAIQLGAVSANSTGSGGNAGTINIYTAAPVITGGSATYNTTGGLTSGSYPTAASSYTINNSSMTITGSVTTTGGAGTSGGTGVAGGNAGAGGAITIYAGSISGNAITTTGGTGGTGGGNAGGVGGAGGNSGNSGNIDVFAINDISLGAVTASGPVGGAAGASATGAGSGGGTGGNAGSVSIVSQSASITLSGGISAAGGNGGFTRNGGTGGNGGQGAAGGAAGNITMSAATSINITTGNVNTTGGTATAGGTVGIGGSLGGAGANGKAGGNISIIAGTFISLGNGFIQSNGGTGSSAGVTNGFSTAIVGGNGASAGTIELRATSSSISVSNGNISASGAGGGVGRSGSTGGSGGNGNTITLIAGTSISLANTNSNGGSGSAGGSTSGGAAGNGGSGGNGGNIVINAGDAVTIATTNANGGGSGIGGTSTPSTGGNGGTGGAAGSISITTPSSITLASGNINATAGNGNGGGSGGTTGGNGGNGGAGGSIAFTGNRLQLLTDVIANGGTGGNAGSGTPSGTAGTNGAGGSLSLTDSNTGTFTIGAATGTNYVGQLQANGGSGGTITVKTAGAVDIVSGNGIVFAMNTVSSGAGGNIQFANTSAGGNVSVNNDGAIQNAQLGATTGIVGFNGGTTGNIAITGAGTITAGAFVNVGNLNPSTLAIIAPFTVVSPFTGTYTNGSGITITQGSISGTLQVTSAPTPSGGTTVTITNPWSQQALAYLLFLAEANAFTSGQQALLNEQIGTRTSVDYLPWRGELVPTQFPLQGNIAVEQLSGAGQALFTANSFNAEEQNALAQQGIVFGSKTGGNFFDLQKGFVLFMPTSDIHVQTKEGLVSIPKGAIAWVMETGNDAAVYDMHDDLHTGKIKVVANGKELTLAPGTEVLMTRDGKADFNTLNPGKEIGVRNIREKDMGEGIKAYIADFTISGGMMNVPVIRNLLKSNNPEQKRAGEKMLKNATILSDLTGAAGAYKTK